MTNRIKKWLLAVKICAVLALLAVLGMWAPIIGSELLEMPANYSYSADIISYDNLYDTASQQYTGKTQSQTTFSYKTTHVEGPVNIVEALFDVRNQDGEQIFSVMRQYGIDHEDYMHNANYGDESREGYLFGPAKNNKNDFIYWHINYDQPQTMVFQNEENILGLNTYHFKSYFNADQTKELTSLPDVGIAKGINLDGELDLWIEPYTGELVKYQDAAMAYYYNLATGERISPWNQFSNQYSYDSVAAHVAQAEQRKNQTFIISEVAPAVLLILIIVFTAWCAFDIKMLWQLRASSIVLTINSAIVMMCVIIISAWIFKDSIDLITLFGTSSETHPSTAIFILLICLCNLFWVLKKTPSRSQILMAKVVLVSIVLLSTINIVCSIAGINFIFTTSTVMVLPVISFGIILLALISIISGDNQANYRYVRARQLLIILIMLLGIVSIIGSAYKFDYAFTHSWYQTANVSTAGIFMALAVAGWDSKILAYKRPAFIEASRPLALALSFVFIGIIVSGIIWNYSKDAVVRNGTLRFENDTNKIENLITQRLDSYKSALQGAKSLFDASSEVTRSNWKAYVDGLQLTENYPGNQGMGYAAIVPSSQKQAAEQQIRDEGYSSFTIWPTESDKETYVPTIYIEPFDARNKNAFGYDMSSEANRYAALQLATDTGNVVMSGEVKLFAATPNEIREGFLLYNAVYRKGTVNNNAEQRKNNIQGYVFSPIYFKNFMQATIGGQNNGVSVSIYDASDENKANSDNLLFTTNSEINPAQSKYAKTTQIQTGARIWTMQYASLPGYVASSSESVPIYVLSSGLSISILLGVAFFGITSSRQRALKLAHGMTNALEKEKNKAVRLQQKDEAILSSIGEGLILYSINGIIERINAAALRMLGRDEKEVIGHRFVDVLKATDENKKAIPANKRPSILATQKDIAINTKLMYVRKNGSAFPVEITVAPIMAQGRAIAAIEVFRDITQEVALDQAKTDFISLASHQLRTPLTTNKWYLGMLLSGEAGILKKEQSSFVQKIDESNERLIELVVSLLNVTRIESGRLSIKPKLTDLGELIDGAVESVKQKLNAKKQQISVEVAKLPKILLDDNMIRQVIMNLLTNAIKYSPDNTKITIKVQQKDNFALCEVSDQGYGIPEDQQKDVFDKFFRAKNIAQKEPDGNGLGLYLVRQIVEASGGKIWFTSELNKGTTFYFTLPIKGMHAKKGEVTLEERDIT